MNYPWPGNVRELQNIIERGVVLSRGSVLTLGENLVSAVPLAESEKAPATHRVIHEDRLALEDVERRHIFSVLKQSGWVIEGSSGAARVLKLHPNTLRSRMKKLGISRPTHEIS